MRKNQLSAPASTHESLSDHPFDQVSESPLLSPPPFQLQSSSLGEENESEEGEPLQMMQDKEAVVQRMISQKNFEEKAKAFIKNHALEAEQVAKVNSLLAEYSRVPTLDVFEMAHAQILIARDAIREIHNQQAALIGECMDPGSDPEARSQFLQTILPNVEEGDTEMFGRIADKVVKGDDEMEDEKFEHLRNRYLSFIVQGLGTKTGKARLEEFDSLLGERNIQIQELGGEYGAGYADFADMEKGNKREKRIPEEDQALFAKVGGNISEFIKQRFAGMLDGKGRTPNEAVGETGDVMMLLEKYQELFPIYLGEKPGNGESSGKAERDPKGKEKAEAVDKSATANDEVGMFTAPLFTAVHHETGHLVNYLKGVCGGGNKFKTAGDGELNTLTDEEEAYNISLDQYSDKVMSDELGLPARIAHKSYMGMDYSKDSFAEEEFMEENSRWNKLAGKKGGQTNFLRDLQLEIEAIPVNALAFHDMIGESLIQVEDWLRFLESEEMKDRSDKQRLADAIAWCLDKLEHKVYDRLAFLQANGPGLRKPQEADFTVLGEDLDRIQHVHRLYIAKIVELDLGLWTTGSLDDRNKANANWAKLVNGTGGIRIDEEASAEFTNEARANMAKLMSRPQGLKLVDTLMGEDDALTLRTPDPEQVIRFREGLESEGILGEELDRQVEATFGGQAGPVDMGASGAVEDEGGVLGHGKGSPSTMSMGTGIKDSGKTSMDEQGKLILSPNFIELGHEMIHALHNLRGASLASHGAAEYQGSAWDNMSEHSVIDGTGEIQNLLGNEYVTENILRGEHNLGVRHGHSTKKTLINAIRLRFLAIVNRPGWDGLGGKYKGLGNGKTPSGIAELRILLAADPVDWASIKTLVDGKSDRGKVKSFFQSVSPVVSDFYETVKEYCDMDLSSPDAIDGLRNFLDDLAGYDPV